jgi:Phytanoyl-CoA dioxygenase (PhyH)
MIENTQSAAPASPETLSAAMAAGAVRFTVMYTQITAPVDAGALHERLYAGDILLFRDLPAMHALVAFARGLLERAFQPHAPPMIHAQLSVEQQAQIFAAAGKEFTRSAAVKELWRNLFGSIGLDAEQLARDRLRLRFQPPLVSERTQPRDVMRSTVPFHRDTWGTNLYAQINWWAPVYSISEQRTMALYPALWDRALRNSSASYDLQALVKLVAEKGRDSITGEMAVPELLESPDPAQAVPVVIEPGSVVVFSSAHAHAGVPNSSDQSRFSLETRTVWIPDVRSGHGAPNVDGAARWMAPGFFYRVSDGEPLNEILGLQRLVPYEGRPSRRGQSGSAP